MAIVSASAPNRLLARPLIFTAVFLFLLIPNTPASYLWKYTQLRSMSVHFQRELDPVARRTDTRNHSKSSSRRKENKKKGKWGRQKKDYSQWASAAAFKENKTFIEAGGDGDTGGGGGGEGGGGDAKDGSGEAKGTEERKRHGTFHATAADSDAPRQPTMPDGTRGFQPGVGRGKRMPPPHPK